MLIDRHNAIFAPHRFVEKFPRGEIRQRFRRRRVPADIVTAIFVNQQATIRVGHLFKRRFDTWSVVRYVILIARNYQCGYVDARQSFSVPTIEWWLGAPWCDGYECFQFASELALVTRAAGRPILQITTGYDLLRQRNFAVPAPALASAP